MFLYNWRYTIPKWTPGGNVGLLFYRLIQKLYIAAGFETIISIDVSAPNLTSFKMDWTIAPVVNPMALQQCVLWLPTFPIRTQWRVPDPRQHLNWETGSTLTYT